MKTWDWYTTEQTTKKQQKTKGTWDKGLDYETTYLMLKEKLNELRHKPFLYKKEKKKYAYLLRLKIVNRLGTWLSKNYGINSHSFRYAYITYLGEKGIPSQVLAKITKHQNINYLERYTQSKLGREILKDLGDIE